LPRLTPDRDRKLRTFPFHVETGTYTSNTPAYISGLATGVKACGSKFGVGLCPVCNQLSENDTETRFTEIRK
jgi:hypothetical protein